MYRFYLCLQKLELFIQPPGLVCKIVLSREITVIQESDGFTGGKRNQMNKVRKKQQSFPLDGLHSNSSEVVNWLWDQFFLLSKMGKTTSQSTCPYVSVCLWRFPALNNIWLFFCETFQTEVILQSILLEPKINPGFGLLIP